MSALSDIWDGITQGVTAKIQNAEQRLVKSTGVTPEQGNTGAYLGLSIVDAISGALHGKADAIQQQVLNSGTGKSLVSQATTKQIAALIGDWRTWAIVLGFILLFMYLGGAIRGARK
jgi:hypothetical protein